MTYTDAYLQQLNIRQHAKTSQTYTSNSGDTWQGQKDGSLKFLYSDFDKRAQNAVGRILTPTNNIKPVYNSNTPSMVFDLTDEGIPGIYGDATHIPQVTVDSKGRVSSITLIPVSGGSGGGGISELTLISGAINNINTVFVWSAPPLLVFWGGQLLRLGVGYTLAGSTTTLTIAPNTGDSLWSYANSTGGSFSELTLVSGVINGINNTFVFSSTVLQIFVEGQLKVDGVGCNITGSTVVFTSGNTPQVGDNVTGFGNV